MSLCQEEVVHRLLSDRVKLLAYIRTIVLSRHAAEDIHQEVVVEALKQADLIDGPDHLFAWARRVAKFKAFKYLRSQQRQPQHFDPDVLELLEPVWDFESAAIPRSMVDALGTCLRELPPRSQKLVQMRFTDQLNGAQISQALGLKLQSVYMALSRIYRVLDDCVKRRMNDAS